MFLSHNFLSMRLTIVKCVFIERPVCELIVSVGQNSKAKLLWVYVKIMRSSKQQNVL